ncbi:MAG: aldo/keto reductase [Pseudomonadota bacterium]
MKRREFLNLALLSGVSAAYPFSTRAQETSDAFMRIIPSSGEPIPAVGLGSWITFNIGNDPLLLEECTAVMDRFFRDGGTMIDCSPMYGSSQDTIGYGLEKLGRGDSVFSAEKVWTRSADERAEQLAQTQSKWGVPGFDLLQVHNLVAWQPHLAALQQMKADGQLKYTGITTSHGRRHRELERIMSGETVDFVQLTYNPVDRDVESRLLPLARERGIAVIVNRPFQRGALTQRLEGRPLPAFASELEADSWAQLIVKFIVSHPAVTCVIPATTRVDHVTQNIEAARGPLPDADLREKIAQAIRNA